MPTTILGIDIGGANLKAATVDERASSLPFPLWKQPDTLPAALAALIAQFPDVEELAVTMTGELCDCFETKREGVNSIIDAVSAVSGNRRIRVWSTEGVFLEVEEARRQHLKVAAANWHALATYSGRYTSQESGLLLDIGTTTTDVIPLRNGLPKSQGSTDWERLRLGELLYIGVRRTPVCAIAQEAVCAELFATTLDVYLVLGMLPENPADKDTADGRPATVPYALARLARMLGADREMLSDEAIMQFAKQIDDRIGELIEQAITAACSGKEPVESRTVIVSGAGEFLAQRVLSRSVAKIVSLNEILNPAVSACAPAYALAMLAMEANR